DEESDPQRAPQKPSARGNDTSIFSEKTGPASEAGPVTSGSLPWPRTPLHRTPEEFHDDLDDLPMGESRRADADLAVVPDGRGIEDLRGLLGLLRSGATGVNQVLEALPSAGARGGGGKVSPRQEVDPPPLIVCPAAVPVSGHGCVADVILERSRVARVVSRGLNGGARHGDMGGAIAVILITVLEILRIHS
ncbi:MAG TPA: hypothetical protein VIL71_00485, partial [Spirillospora sp.]